MVSHRMSRTELNLVRDGGGATEMRGLARVRPDMLALAREIQADVAGLNAVVQSIERAVDVIEAALAGALRVQDILREMRGLALQASDPARSAAERAALDERCRALAAGVSEQVAGGEVHGMNLLSRGSQALEALIDANTGESVRVPGEDLAPGGPNILFGAEDGIADASHARMTAGLIGLSLANVERAVARLALGRRKLDAHGCFVLRLSECLRNGVGPAASPEWGGDAARLRALCEVQGHNGSTAPAGPASGLLALFR